MALIPAKCTQCGANIQVDDTKEAGICESCGTAFITEKVINNYHTNITNNNVFYGATVNVAGPNLDNLYQTARRFRKNSNVSEAAKYYNMILSDDPSSWEAFFYCTYYKAAEAHKYEVQEAAQSIVICLDTVFDMIEEKENGESEKIAALKDVADSCMSLVGSFNNFVLSPDGVNVSMTELPSHLKAVAMTCLTIATISYMVGDKIEQRFPHLFGQLTDVCVKAWKQGVEIHQDCNRQLPNKQQGQQIINEYAMKIQKYDPSYNAVSSTTQQSSGGCYVATCVYGSYDCPEVWTLRRFRDNTLAATWYGRAFIRIYYAISPTLVQWFGETCWFKKVCQSALDKMVGYLQNTGVENTPYQDKSWR